MQKMISVDHLDALEQKRPQRHAWDSHTNALIRSIAISFSYKICLALGQLNRPWRLLLGGTSPSAIKTASHLPKLHLWQEYCASSTHTTSNIYDKDSQFLAVYNALTVRYLCPVKTMVTVSCSTYYSHEQYNHTSFYVEYVYLVLDYEHIMHNILCIHHVRAHMSVVSVRAHK